MFQTNVDTHGASKVQCQTQQQDDSTCQTTKTTQEPQGQSAEGVGPNHVELLWDVSGTLVYGGSVLDQIWPKDT